MKLAILLFGAFITGIISLSAPVTNIKGTWVMQTGEGMCNPVVIRISMGEGTWVGKMDIPEQQVYDKEVDAIIVKDDSVFIGVSKSGNSIKAVLQNKHTLTGKLVTDSGEKAVEFIKR